MIKKNFSFLFIIGALAIFLPKEVGADLGPKPNVDIDVIYNQQDISDPSFSAKMLSCGPEDAAQKQPGSEEDLIPQLKISQYDSLKNCYWYPSWFAWGGQCSNSACNFGYMPPDEFKLAIFIPSLSKTFVTNEVSRTNFNSHYRVELSSDRSAKISETTPVFSSDKISSFIKAFLITILLELLVSLFFISLCKLPKKILSYVLFANIISLPIVWFLFPLFKLYALTIIVASEIFAVLFESYFIYFFGKQIVSLKQSFVLSIVNNLVSLFVGSFIYIILGLFA